MLSQAQVQFYKDNGYIAVSNILSDAEVRHLQEVTDGFLERSRKVTKSDDIFDIEEGHTAEHPRLRRIKRPIKQHPPTKLSCIIRGCSKSCSSSWAPPSATTG